jgi:hypothetical protein
MIREDAHAGTPDAINALARRLYGTMDRIDPAPGSAWDEIDEENREFYRECIRDLLKEETLIQLALEVPVTTE